MPAPILFAGPSLHGIDPALLQGIDLQPPAGKGDLLAATLAGADTIGLIDGTFEYGAAVWHKEILFALDRGVAIFGAASMGALRAAECAAFGMVGVGTVYADYAEGRRQSDADVAIVHAPAALGYRPLTEALVDIDATLTRLCAAGHLAPDMTLRLLNAAVAAHFKDRTWSQIVAAAGYQDEAARKILALVGANRISAKTEDALALIDMLRAFDASEGPKSRLSTPFNRTLFFETLEQQVEMRQAAGKRP